VVESWFLRAPFWGVKIFLGFEIYFWVGCGEAKATTKQGDHVVPAPQASFQRLHPDEQEDSAWTRVFGGGRYTDGVAKPSEAGVRPNESGRLRNASTMRMTMTA
jgi:hypothetical protein